MFYLYLNKTVSPEEIDEDLRPFEMMINEMSKSFY